MRLSRDCGILRAEFCVLAELPFNVLVRPFAPPQGVRASSPQTEVRHIPENRTGTHRGPSRAPPGWEIVQGTGRCLVGADASLGE